MPKLFNRIKETSTSIGTGDFTFGGVSAPDFFTFGSVLADNDQFLYEINHSGVAAEQGIGTYHSATNSFTRTTVKSGSNGTSPVNFVAGSKDVFVSYIAESAVMRDAANTFTVGPQTIQTGADGTVGEIVKGNSSSQSVDLQQWQKTSANTRARVTKDGEFSNPAPNDSAATGNEAFGTGALAALTSGQNNVAFGKNALGVCTTAGGNIAFGQGALSALLTGNGGNFAIGANCLSALTTGNTNFAIGPSALNQSLTDNYNMGIGSAALQHCNGGSENVAIGASNPGNAVTTGSQNTLIGGSVAQNLSQGSHNVIIGHYGGLGIAAGASTITTGGSNTLLGDQAGLTAGTNSNATALGVNAVAQANEFALSPNTNFQTFYVLSSTSVLQPRADFTVSNVDNTNATRKYRIVVNVWDTTQHEAFRAEASGTAALISFFGAAAVAQQTDGAALTNNVTSGGTTDTIANFTDLATYANDAAAIRNDIYQLARKIKIVDDALRAYGLLT